MVPYLSFFGFDEEPFRVTPDPAFLFLSKNHREAFAHLLYGVERRCGFVALTGEIGTGKTTLLRAFFAHLNPAVYKIAYLFNPRLNPQEMLHAVCREFALEDHGESRVLLFDRLNRFLLEENGTGRSVLLVIDEAQNLSPETLEEIRLLSNLETDREKLIQILLVGQPELADLLQRAELVQLSQRISVRFHLDPVDFEDSCAYVRHRLRLAGCPDRDLFPLPALTNIYKFSKGYPRLINTLCDRALLIAYTRGNPAIGPETIRDAVHELGWVSSARFPLGRWLWGTVLAAAVFVGLGMVIGYGSRQIPPGEKPLAGTAADGNALLQACPVPPSGAKDGLAGEIEKFRLGLAVRSEGESARAAFDAVANRWGVRKLGSWFAAIPYFQQLVEAAQRRGLEVWIADPSLEELLVYNTPAILEVTLPGLQEKRYLAVTVVDEGRIYIAPSLAGSDHLSVAEVKGLWSGRALIFWKDYRGIYRPRADGRRSADLAGLQNLLHKAAFFQGNETGLYDEPTREGIRLFRRHQGLAQSGGINEPLLILLYQQSDVFQPPRLKLAAAEGNPP